VGIVAIVVALPVCGARAEAQQPPKISRIGYLTADFRSERANSGTALNFKHTQTAAQELHMQLQSLDTQSVNDLEVAFEAATKGGAQALVALSSTILIFISDGSRTSPQRTGSQQSTTGVIS
jgi:hypothetical protein